MFSSSLPMIGAFFIALLATAGLFISWQKYRPGAAPLAHKRAGEIARRHGLSPGGGAIPAFVREAVAPSKREEVDQLLVGRDKVGSMHVGRRRNARTRQNFLLAELPIDYQLGQLRLNSWMEEKTQGRRKNRSLQSQISWTSGKGALGSESARTVVKRLCMAWDSHSSRLAQMPLRLELEGRRLLILSEGPVDPRRLEDFIELALEVRKDVIGARPSVEIDYSGHSGALGTLAGTGAGLLVAKGDPAVASAMAALEETRPVANLSSYDLVRDSRPVQALGRGARNGIPEPEDEVVVLSGHGTLR